MSCACRVAPELFDKLFLLLIEQNKPIEINTRRLDDAAAVAGLLPLYKRYRELGGKYCTLGSDAHYKEHVGRRFWRRWRWRRRQN